MQAKNDAIRAENTVSKIRFEGEQAKVQAEAQAAARIAQANGEAEAQIAQARGQREASGCPTASANRKARASRRHSRRTSANSQAEKDDATRTVPTRR